jgi:hypothetical protein
VTALTLLASDRRRSVQLWERSRTQQRGAGMGAEDVERVTALAMAADKKRAQVAGLGTFAAFGGGDDDAAAANELRAKVRSRSYILRTL